MTPQQIDAMKLALEALDIAQGMLADLRSQHQPKMLSAYTALEEVLAEHAMCEVQRLGQVIEQAPVQKPVAVVSSCTGVGDKGVRVKWLGGFPQIGDRLYFHPPQRNPLTKEEMFEAIRPLYSSEMSARIAVDYSEDEYRAIEAAHGIKENT